MKERKKLPAYLQQSFFLTKTDLKIFQKKFPIELMMVIL